MPLTEQNISVFQTSFHVVLVASRLYAEAKACRRQVIHRLGEEAQHKGYRKARKVKKAVQKGEKQGETSGGLFIKNKPIIISERT